MAILIFCTVLAFYQNLWGKGDHLMETIPLKCQSLGKLAQVEVQSPFRLWPGLEPVCSVIPRHPKHKWFLCTTVSITSEGTVAGWGVARPSCGCGQLCPGFIM